MSTGEQVLRFENSVIGARVSGRLAARLGGGWVLVPACEAECPLLLRDRKPVARRVGDQVSVWVLGIDLVGEWLLVTDDPFGSLPISDGMRARYRQALRGTLSILRGSAPVETGPISETKGMFNRCLRRDQRDWLSVYLLLGRPDEATLQSCVSWLAELRRAAAAGDTAATLAAEERLESMGLEGVLDSALTALESSTPHLAAGRQTRSRAQDTQHDGPRLVVAEIDLTKTRDATALRQRTLDSLRAYLEQAGYRVEENVQIDAWARLRAGPAIFEVKSTTPDNEVTQLRAAMSQLYEYRYRFEPTASLWIVLSSTVSAPNSWMVGYLHDDREIGVLWTDESGELTGPWLGRLTETLHAAKLRDPI